MSKYRIGNTFFETKEAKERWILEGILHSVKYIGTESKLSFTEKQLQKLAIKHLNNLIKTKKS